MDIYIMAGGPEDHHPDLDVCKNAGVVWAAVDRGVYYLLKKGIVPNVAFGDYDSVTEEELAWIEKKLKHIHIVPREKDETDLELALHWAIEQRPNAIWILGATGGRLDHALANVQMLIKGVEAGICMKIIDYKNEITLKKPGLYHIEADVKYPYLSFLPMTEKVTGITLEGVKYPLQNKTIYWGSTLCISNELVEEKGTFSFATGILMVIRSTD
ncbi:MAG: thiamine diphosphokinase [Ectobacillus sp.]